MGLLMEMPSDAGAGCDGGSDFSALAAWIEKLAEMVERQQGAPFVSSSMRVGANRSLVKTIITTRVAAGPLTWICVCVCCGYVHMSLRTVASLEVVSTREKVARQVDRAVKTVVAAYAENRLDVQGEAFRSELLLMRK